LKNKQYGKSSASYIEQKQSYFDNNDEYIKIHRKISNVYVQQPIRLRCKNCDHELKIESDFVKDGVGYKICSNCSHLNGAHEDTTTFCEAVYTKDDGESYAQAYKTKDLEDFEYRLSSIYIPKAEFLYTSLLGHGVDPHQMKYFDLGAGSGYFVGALSKIGLKNISGSEVSKYQVEFGNRMIGGNFLSVHQMDNTNQVIEETDANVISFMGVLEHLQDFRSALECVKNNDKIEYLYISVPLFSLSVFLEMTTNNAFHRHLTGGHTHLFTKDSLQYLADEFEFDIVSEWWFGSDIADLYRHIMIDIKKDSQCSQVLINSFKEMFLPLIDSMQLELDKRSQSSEVHLLLKKQ